MKSFLRKFFNPILSLFEKGSEDFRPDTRRRPILLIMCVIFMVLAIAVPIIAPIDVRAGAWFPTLVFGGIGFTGFIVGTLGSDRAVAKLLGGI